MDALLSPDALLSLVHQVSFLNQQSNCHTAAEACIAAMRAELAASGCMAGGEGSSVQPQAATPAAGTSSGARALGYGEQLMQLYTQMQRRVHTML